MIIRDATPVSFLIDFSSGFPDGGIAWTLRGETGATITTGTITPTPLSLSTVLAIGSVNNTLSGSVLTGYRDVDWTYTVGGTVINGRVRYSIEARLRFGVSEDGVRSKLGVDNVELPDSEISLAQGYMDFQSVFPSTDLDLISSPNSRIKDAIEALTALRLLPTMQIRIALKESSGTSQFQRQAVNWSAVAASLYELAGLGYLEVDPLFDPTTGFGSIFILAGPATDPFTGITA